MTSQAEGDQTPHPDSPAAMDDQPPVLPVVTERDMPDLAEVRARLLRSWDDVSDLHDSLRVLAVDVLAMAQTGGMPDSYWHTDRRVRRALAALGVTPEQAQRVDWTELPGPRS